MMNKARMANLRDINKPSQVERECICPNPFTQKVGTLLTHNCLRLGLTHASENF